MNILIPRYACNMSDEEARAYRPSVLNMNPDT